MYVIPEFNFFFQSSTPINVLPKEQPAPQRPISSILTEQLQLKQLMMEKQLELLHKQVTLRFYIHLNALLVVVFLLRHLQQQILEKEFHQKTTANSSMEQVSKSTSIQTTTRATSPIKRECKTAVVERATSPVKQPTPIVNK